MNTTEPVPIYDSSLQVSSALEELRQILRYRNLVYQMTRRDIVSRYKRSVLGIAWTMLNPLGTTIILAIVFSSVFGGTRGYAPYVLSGLIAWTFFAQTTHASMVGMIWGSSLIKRIYVPRTVFAVSAIGTGLVNICLSLVPLFLIEIFFGIMPGLSLILLPIPVLFLAMFALGIGLLLSTVAIYFADVIEMYQIVLTAWFYLSPVIYPVEMLPPEVRWLLQLNPMYYFITLFRALVYEGRIPSASEFLITGGIACVTLLAGWIVFSKKSDEFAYRV
jgi:ABC-type polysaccharide/polyol phosphate export permease